MIRSPTRSEELVLGELYIAYANRAVLYLRTKNDPKDVVPDAALQLCKEDIKKSKRNTLPLVSRSLSLPRHTPATASMPQERNQAIR